MQAQMGTPGRAWCRRISSFASTIENLTCNSRTLLPYHPCASCPVIGIYDISHRLESEFWHEKCCWACIFSIFICVFQYADEFLNLMQSHNLVSKFNSLSIIQNVCLQMKLYQNMVYFVFTWLNCNIQITQPPLTALPLFLHVSSTSHSYHED